MAKKLGAITADYRWFAVVYIVASFFIIPLIIFGLSLAGW
jgi:sodium-dependent phosphate cotransporter